jgi:hypothetical protein
MQRHLTHGHGREWRESRHRLLAAQVSSVTKEAKATGAVPPRPACDPT